ncbi:hypothetical protein [Desulfolutivibrio sulfoxidireducens]|uniref:hypothetical protein n=1 Tax=Desulfolutivibrio sulfoxidireducens TaxID=2773299 RepID=UPI00159E14A4|nr:hypothetical protein [Desulfolutivibrio sulfoxidireducens]
MVSTSSISSLGALRPFIERAFHRTQSARTETALAKTKPTPALAEKARPSRKATGAAGS